MKDVMVNRRPTYLVTGASGFVGGALASRLLSRGDDVVCLLRDGYAPSGASIVRGDLSNYDDCVRAVMKAGPHCRVFHLGAQAKVGYARNNRLETFESNVRGTYNLLEAVNRHSPFSPVVVASSDKAYGELDEQAKYIESDPMEGRGIYDVSKSCTDLIAQAYAHQGLELAIVRAGNIYGPTDKDLSRVVPSICRDICRAKGPVIRSDGTPVRDYLYISDAVDAYMLLMDRLVDSTANVRGQAYNFSGGEPMSVLGLTEMMIRIWNKDRGFFEDASTAWSFPTIEKTRTDEIPYQVLDCTKARTELGWSPQVGLKQGLLKTLSWWYFENRKGL